jgi:hypothetical protein
LTTRGWGSPPRKIVAVVWLDICTRGDWVGDREEVLKDMTPVPCVTVGWLLYDSPERLIVVDSASKDKDYGGVTVIPRSVVLKIDELKRITPNGYLSKFP